MDVMNTNSRLIKSVVKSEILLNEVKRMVFTEMVKLRGKKKKDMYSMYSEARFTIFKGIKF